MLSTALQDFAWSRNHHLGRLDDRDGVLTPPKFQRSNRVGSYDGGEGLVADVRKDYAPSPVQQDDEVTELVGLCLWDIFSDNHEVIAADGRLADIGSFRGSGAFIDQHLTSGNDWWREGDYLRFCLGTMWIARRADLAPVYAMIFSRLKALGADWATFPGTRDRRAAIEG